jgi:uncharacterized membrane protein YgdD (TMEM256/DUF423 family)
MDLQVSSVLGNRLLAAAGSVLAAVAVALAAYASHAASGHEQTRLLHAALFGFGHGIALAALAPQASRRLGRLSLSLMLTGVLLFSGSLAAAALLGTSTRLAPAGGSLMILAWLLHAANALRR